MEQNLTFFDVKSSIQYSITFYVNKTFLTSLRQSQLIYPSVKLSNLNMKLLQEEIMNFRK